LALRKKKVDSCGSGWRRWGFDGVPSGKIGKAAFNIMMVNDVF
jgi:hypothetical protein